MSKPSENESSLLFTLAEMVCQHCASVGGVYETGFIGVNKDAMEILVSIGAMECVKDGSPGRGYWARFVPCDDPLLSVRYALDKDDL